MTDTPPKHTLKGRLFIKDPATFISTGFARVNMDELDVVIVLRPGLLVNDVAVLIGEMFDGMYEQVASTQH